MPGFAQKRRTFLEERGGHIQLAIEIGSHSVLSPMGALGGRRWCKGVDRVRNIALRLPRAAICVFLLGLSAPGAPGAVHEDAQAVSPAHASRTLLPQWRHLAQTAGDAGSGGRRHLLSGPTAMDTCTAQCTTTWGTGGPVTTTAEATMTTTTPAPAVDPRCPKCCEDGAGGVDRAGFQKCVAKCVADPSSRSVGARRGVTACKAECEVHCNPVGYSCCGASCEDSEFPCVPAGAATTTPAPAPSSGGTTAAATGGTTTPAPSPGARRRLLADSLASCLAECSAKYKFTKVMMCTSTKSFAPSCEVEFTGLPKDATPQIKVELAQSDFEDADEYITRVMVQSVTIGRNYLKDEGQGKDSTCDEMTKIVDERVADGRITNAGTLKVKIEASFEVGGTKCPEDKSLLARVTLTGSGGNSVETNLTAQTSSSYAAYYNLSITCRHCAYDAFAYFPITKSIRDGCTKGGVPCQCIHSQFKECNCATCPDIQPDAGFFPAGEDADAAAAAAAAVAAATGSFVASGTPAAATGSFVASGTPAPDLRTNLPGVGLVKVTAQKTFASPDSEARAKGFSITLGIPGMESVGVDFPAGAWPDGVNADIRITVYEPPQKATLALGSDQLHAGLMVDFYPELTFKKKVTVKLPLNAGTIKAVPDGLVLEAFYYSGTDNAWESRRHSVLTPEYSQLICPGETMTFSAYGALLVKKKISWYTVAGATIGSIVGFIALGMVAFSCYRQSQTYHEEEILYPESTSRKRLTGRTAQPDRTTLSPAPRKEIYRA